jgi:preprotein translocase subunit Sec63
MSQYLVKILPSKVTGFLYHLNPMMKLERWVEKPDKHEDVTTKAQALFLARESASNIVNFFNNNKNLVDEAFKIASVKSSSSGDEESSGQDHEQEGGDEEDMEENKNNNT